MYGSPCLNFSPIGNRNEALGNGNHLTAIPLKFPEGHPQCIKSKKKQSHKFETMVIKNLENKIKLVGIVCTAFLVGCILISVSSIWTARTMVADAHKKVYVLDGNVPILVSQTTMDETLDVEAKSHVEMFHHYLYISFPSEWIRIEKNLL